MANRFPYGTRIPGQQTAEGGRGPFGPPTLDEFLQEDYGLEPLALDETPLPEFEGGAKPGFVEDVFGDFDTASLAGLGQSGFGGGLLSGFVGGLATRGQQRAKRRAEFEAASEKRRAARDQANREATIRYRSERGKALADLRRDKTAEEKAQRDYERETVPVTPQMLREMPWLARSVSVGDRVPQSVAFRPPDKEPRGSDRVVSVEGPDGKPVYVLESDAVGRTPASGREKPRAPAMGEREMLTNDIAFVGKINDLRDSYKKEYVGPVAGRVGGLTQATGIGRKKGEGTFRSRLAGIRNEILKLRSGGAVTEGEAARLLEELPTSDNPSENFEEKLDSFENIFRTIAQTRRDVMTGTGLDLSRVPELPVRGRVVRGPDGRLVMSR